MLNYGEKKNCLLFIFNFLCHLAIAHTGNIVPVMLWSGETSTSLINPLHNTSKAEFEEILIERLGKSQPPIIVFVKDNFCVEDIKQHKESLQMLSSIQTLSYLTSVESPISVFENLSAYNVTIEDDLDSVAESQLALMQVNDINAIPIIYNMVKISSPNLVVALTGKSCSFTSSERIKRAVVNDDQPLRVNKSNMILFYAEKKPLIKIYEGGYYQLANPTSALMNGNNLSMVFTGQENNKIKLEAQFVKSHNGYIKMIGFSYYLEENKTNVLLKSNMDIEFPSDVSYHCGSENVFTFKNKSDQKSISLKLINWQVQFNASKFGEVYDCVGFMSIPIWTGIFVTAILALIMIWGLTMIMDIRTMDRFDDPKGKTITISAQE